MAEKKVRYYRKVMRIRAEDSPNVRYALAQIAAGLEPTGEVLLPGVLPWNDYVKRRATWDAIRQCIGLDAQFYEGSEVLLYPPEWLNRAEKLAEKHKDRTINALSLGIDPAEGGDKTCYCVIDEYGLVELISTSTPDTSVITGDTIALIKRYKIPHHRVLFDRGGGGKEHADRLRQQGYNVGTIAFGESVTPPIKRGITGLADKIDQKEDRYTYKNRRAEMYGMLRNLLDPSNEKGFAIPSSYTELRRQMAPIPLTYDPEGRLEILPKAKRDSEKNSSKRTLTEILGCSPDQLDSLVLAVYGAYGIKDVPKIGAAW